MDIDKIVEEINSAEKKGKRSWIIIVSEGFSSAHTLTKKIKEKTGYSVRGVTLGHIQRGGSPNAPDRVLASTMGPYAVKALMEGHSDKMVGVKGHRLELIPYVKACFERDKDKELYTELYSLTKLLAT
jgi:6-phosphofructokinase 1